MRFLHCLAVLTVLAGSAGAALAQTAATAPASSAPAFWAWAKTPPMGWNSWDCFGTGVTEAQVRANADYMAEKLAPHGWQYIVVDIQWYEPQAHGYHYRPNATLEMDRWGRLIPAANRFPSAADGKAFKPLADYVHGKGLKFGIHMMRGIPRQAVEQNTPIFGTSFHAADIADKSSTCPWNPDMYGVDMARPGAQAYYDSVLDLVASWGVDFVKVDDLSRPYFDHIREVEAIRKAIDRTGRPIVFSTSPGATPLEAGPHVSHHANMWRISRDFWDRWKSLLEQFDRCRDWTPYRGEGHWPDADMLPLGAIHIDKPNGWTRFTHDEQYTLMTLWSISRSPLIFGGDLPKNDPFTLQLITNDEVIAVDQHSANGRELSNHDGLIVWVAAVPNSSDRYAALFNTRDQPSAIAVTWKDLGLAGACRVRDLWKRQDAGTTNDRFVPTIAAHGAGLYRVPPR